MYKYERQKEKENNILLLNNNTKLCNYMCKYVFTRDEKCENKSIS